MRPALALILVTSCAHPPPPAPHAPPVPASHSRKVTTHSPEAQKHFDEGLLYLYAFHHDQAIRAFGAAAAADPACAMAWWGVAMANGPHINNPAVDEAHARAARDALQRAQNAAEASPTERALVAALGKRYANPQPA